MSLTLKISKTAVKFEVSDEDAETVVTLFAEDGAETLIRKLRKVIALVEPEGAVTPFRAMAQAAGIPPNALRHDQPPEIPDRLKGIVEMEDAPVVGNGWKNLGDGEGLPGA